MIFDCDEVTGLVSSWQVTKDETTLSAIMDGCQRLIEAVVSTYDADMREDLIQEVRTRFIYAFSYYNSDHPSPHSLYNYLTTVARNACATFVRKQHNEYCDELLDDAATVGDAQTTASDEELLQELTVHNRKRFPSLPTADLDDMTETFYYAIKNGDGSKAALSGFADSCIPKSIALVVYNSMLIFMRAKFVSNAKIQLDDEPEFSLVRDLRELLGDQVYATVLIAFSGMSIRFPSK